MIEEWLKNQYDFFSGRTLQEVKSHEQKLPWLRDSVKMFLEMMIIIIIIILWYQWHVSNYQVRDNLSGNKEM
jgi:hypothetical protein